MYSIGNIVSLAFIGNSTFCPEFEQAVKTDRSKISIVFFDLIIAADSSNAANLYRFSI